MGILKKVLAIVPYKKKYLCSVCKHKLNFMEGYGVKSPIFEQLNIVGGGYRENVTCPICGANDRIRWIDIILEKYTSIYTQKCTVLHIAPETVISKKIRRNQECNYVTGDIEKGKADTIVDVTDMQFEDGCFDFIIMNHVLEHVAEEKKAMSELKRCLKINGKLIVSFPICLSQVTFEDEHITTEEDCLKFYGQKDHCRLYGTDSKMKLEAYEFSVVEYKVADLIAECEIKKLALMNEDRIFICERI